MDDFEGFKTSVGKVIADVRCSKRPRIGTEPEDVTEQ